MPSLTLISGIDWESVGFGLGFGLVIHLYLALALLGIAKKLRMTEKRWQPWVPLANLFFIARLAKKPRRWAGTILVLFPLPIIILLFQSQIKTAVGSESLITVVAIITDVISIAVALILQAILWSHIARRRGYSGWPGFILPFSFPVNLIIIAILAWSPDHKSSDIIPK